MSDDGILSSLRYLFADIIGDDDDTPPSLPEGLPHAVAPVALEAIDRLTAYQGRAYAQLYVDRLRRFTGRHAVDDATLQAIARLMAMRMTYQDPIRIAQLKLAAAEGRAGLPPDWLYDDRLTFRIDELIGALPALVADPLLGVLQWAGWTHAPVSIRFSAANGWGLFRLKIEASLRRWRRFSVRYGEERVWVERWLHMIDRSLTLQPAAAAEIARTATMIQGYGDPYRQGLADWHAIIDGLVKPTFDGVLPVSDLAGAVAQARAAAMPDPQQAALKRKIAEIRAQALEPGAGAPSTMPSGAGP